MADNNSKVRINDNLNFKLNEYVKTLKKNNVKYLDTEKNKFYDITATSILNELLEDYLKDKIILNEYIPLKKPFYFNLKELKDKKQVKAFITKPPIVNDIFFINQIPNNLDTFNKEFKHYCFEDNKYLHRGLKFILNPEYQANNGKWSFTGLNKEVYVYDYNLKENKLNMSLLDYNELTFLFSDNMAVIKIMDNFKNEIKLLIKLFKQFNNTIIFDWDISENSFKFKNLKSEIFLNQHLDLDLDSIIDVSTLPNLKYFENNLIHYDFTKAVFNPEKYSLINFDLKNAYGIDLFEKVNDK